MSNELNSNPNQTSTTTQPEPETENNAKTDPQPTAFQSPYPVLSKYNNILIPSVFAMDLNKIEAAPWREANAKQSDYFNYGFNEDQWKKYSSIIQGKFDSLSELVAQQKYNFPKLKDEFNYLLNFPSDYGGLGDVLNDQKFDNVNFFELKANSHQMAPLIRIDHDQLYVPLEVNSPALNSNNGNYPNNSVPLINNFISVPYNSFPVMPGFNPELYKYMYQQNLLMPKEEMMKKQDIESDKQSKTNEKKHSSKKSSKSGEKSESDNSDSDSDDSNSSSESSERQKKKKRHKRHSHRSRSRSRDTDESHKKKKKKRSSHSKSRERYKEESRSKKSRSRSRSKERSKKKDKGEDDRYESKKDKHRRRKH